MQDLPIDFGMQAPNLRTLNLNYNALGDLRPLLGILRLQKIYLAGNRISRLRRTAAVLERVGRELVEVDFRGNGLVVGFYMPQAQSQSCASEQQLTLQKPSSSSAHYNPPPSDDEDTDPSLNYLLAPLSHPTDNAARHRLDQDTKLRRRVYEMLIVAGCKRLKVLDGLEVDRAEVAYRDEVWERLREVGVLRIRDGGKGSREEGREEGGSEMAL